MPIEHYPLYVKEENAARYGVSGYFPKDDPDVGLSIQQCRWKLTGYIFGAQRMQRALERPPLAGCSRMRGYLEFSTSYDSEQCQWVIVSCPLYQYFHILRKLSRKPGLAHRSRSARD